MAKPPNSLKPRANARATAQKMRDAFVAAKSRTGGEGRLVAISAGGLLLAFVLLATLAPVLMNAPAFVSSLIGFVLLVLVVASTAIGAIAVWRIIKAGAKDNDTGSGVPTSIYSQTAIEAALSDAEDAGLRALGPRSVQEALTGRVHGRAMAVMRADGKTYAVIRLKDAVTASVLVAPGSAPWPYAFPNDGVLTPIPVPQSLSATAWTTKRDEGLSLMPKLAPALAMSAAGGELPYLSLRSRALVLMWTKADVGSATVIAYEFAKAFA
jgi:hypothetical protein